MAKCDGIRAANIDAAKREAAMSSEPKVIAEAGAVKIYSDGTASGGLTVELGQLGMARILADAVRRVRDEFREEMREAIRAEDRLTERIEAVEQESYNIVKHIESVREEGVSGHNHLADRVAEVENSDKGRASNITRRVKLLAALSGRVDALEQEAKATTENEQATAARLDAVERLTGGRSSGMIEKKANTSLDVLGAHGNRIDAISGRVAALEDRQQGETGMGGPRVDRVWTRKVCGECGEQIEAVERYHEPGSYDDLCGCAPNDGAEPEKQDEAGEGACQPQLSPCDDLIHRVGQFDRETLRRETAREIGDWLRGEGWPILAQRMEREYLDG